MNNLDNTNNSTFALSEDWVEKIRQGAFTLTVEAEKETEDSFDVASWDTFELSEDWVAELRQDDLALTSQGNSLKWKDTLD